MIETFPGLRRTFRIVPEAAQVTAALADDFHDMVVTLLHDGATITALESQTRRAPFDICGGAKAFAQRSFIGLPLAAALPAAQKPENCTHLYDLAVLAAAHALDGEPLTYDILVSDPLDGVVHSEIRRNGAKVLQWQWREGVMLDPPRSGLTLKNLRNWIATLPKPEAEAARMLQWGTMMGMARPKGSVQNGKMRDTPLRCYAHSGAAAHLERRLTANRRDFTDGLPQADATPLV
jgi:hypothetical protein